MRAKMQVGKIDKFGEPCNAINLQMVAVCGTGAYGQDGESEDNTYAHWTPSATVTMCITNPNLFNKFTEGQKFYVDFTEV